MNRSSISISEGRLQRASQNPSIYISKFRQVVLRHGITMSTISVACLFFPNISAALLSSLNNFFLNINTYFFVCLILAFFMLFILKIYFSELNFRQISWIGYLLSISIVEEIGFRVSLPILFSNSFLSEYSFLIGIFISNLLFASLHYFTLRWKLKACIFTFLGGIGLSRLFYVTEDLALIILVHWAITFMNTPRAPIKIRQ